jgi:hypothetical protein
MGGKKHLKSHVGLDRGAPMLETLSRDHDQKAKFQKKNKNEKLAVQKFVSRMHNATWTTFKNAEAGPIIRVSRTSRTN